MLQANGQISPLILLPSSFLHLPTPTIFFNLLFYPFYCFVFLQFIKFTFSLKYGSTRLGLNKPLKKKVSSFYSFTLSQLLIAFLFFFLLIHGVHGFINAMALFLFAVLQNYKIIIKWYIVLSSTSSTFYELVDLLVAIKFWYYHL